MAGTPRFAVSAGAPLRLFTSIAGAMRGIREGIAERQVARFDQMHPDYGAGARAAGGSMTCDRVADYSSRQTTAGGAQAAE